MNAPDTDFSDRWVLVSGASSGIGRAVAVALARNGARVVLVGRRPVELEATATLCGGSARAEILPLDLSDPAGIGPAVTTVTARTGRLYGLCHAAGVVSTLPLSATTPERLARMLDINLVAGLELARAVTRRDVLDPQGASLLWIASVYAHVGAPGQVGYSAAKGAVTAAVRSLALELAPRRVRVNCISPGLVRTPMTEVAGSRMSEAQWEKIAAMHPLGTGRPEDVARAAAFMLSPRNPWLTGADLIIDGGYTLH